MSFLPGPHCIPPFPCYFLERLTFPENILDCIETILNRGKRKKTRFLLHLLLYDIFVSKYLNLSFLIYLYFCINRMYIKQIFFSLKCLEMFLKNFKYVFFKIVKEK